VLGIFITVFLLPAGLFFGEFQMRFRVRLGTPLSALLRLIVYQTQQQIRVFLRLIFPQYADYQR